MWQPALPLPNAWLPIHLPPGLVIERLARDTIEVAAPILESSRPRLTSFELDSIARQIGGRACGGHRKKAVRVEI